MENIYTNIVVVGIVSIIIFCVYSSIKYNRKESAERRCALEAEEQALKLQREKSEALRRKAEEESRLKHIADVNILIPKINQFILIFNKLRNFNSGYFNHYQLRQWLYSSQPTYEQISRIPYRKLNLESHHEALINMFIDLSLEGESVRQAYNTKFVEHELESCAQYFDDIEGKSLDVQQRNAVVINEDNNLVVAGAGSGKTTTIAAKVKYVIDRYKVAPSEILLLSFTRKACEEMRERIKQRMNIEVDVMTFHKLGCEVIAAATNKQPDRFDDSRLPKLINDFLLDQMNNREYSSKLTRYFIEYLKPYKEEREFENRGCYIQYMKDHHIRSCKQLKQDIKGRVTVLREQCRSMEEVSIANYLFFNNIKYEYERPYEYNTASRNHRQYKPDFFLPDYGIYIEHFGVDKNNNIPHWFDPGDYQAANIKYQDDMVWKRQCHREHGTKLIETFSHEKHEGVLLSNLEDKLLLAGVTIRPKSQEEIWGILNAIAEDEVLSFTELLITFLSLLKSNNHTIAEINGRNEKFCRGYDKLRNRAFLEIFAPIYDHYAKYLNKNHKIDFSDMINYAEHYVRNGVLNQQYKYVIIDEFQDISIGRYKLVKAILNANPGCKLFCVGDDWQSIFRFTGSDLSIFTEFEKYFGITSKSFIETTYRFDSRLIDISSGFILKNPKQVAKRLRSSIKTDSAPYEILYSDNIFNKDTLPVIKALESIAMEVGDIRPDNSVLLLGRYKYDIELIRGDQVHFSVQEDKVHGSFKILYKPFPALNIEFLTIHKAKGLEADYVIVLNCSAGKYGFPSEQSDDPVLNLLLTQADQFPNGEERRLFYVALTRCRHKVFLTTNTVYKSKFIIEMEERTGDIPIHKCPLCKTGILKETSGVSVKGRAWKRLYCSNWWWECDYIKWLENAA